MDRFNYLRSKKITWRHYLLFIFSLDRTLKNGADEKYVMDPGSEQFVTLAGPDNYQGWTRTGSGEIKMSTKFLPADSDCTGEFAIS